MNNLLEYATTRAKLLFGCYRRGDANDPDTYVAAIAAVLCGYDSDLIRDVTDPRVGICSDEKFATFPPNVGELKRYCEAKAIHREHLKRLGARRPPISSERRLAAPDPRDAPDGAWSNLHVPATNLRYAAMVAWSKTADRRQWKFGKSSDGIDGIWVTHAAWTDRPSSPRQHAVAKSSMVLSDAALKVMRDIDAERNHDLPGDQEAAQ